MKDFLQGKWLGHPLHPLFVHIPTALWPSALVLDILSMLGVGGNAMVQTSFYAILFGLITALIGIPFGLADWWGIGKDKPAWALGAYHMILNLTGAVFWALNLGLRAANLNRATQVTILQLMLSLIGVFFLFVAVYLGERMVFGFGTSVARISKEYWRRIAEAGGSKTSQ